jgi:hypothetical protein
MKLWRSLVLVFAVGCGARTMLATGAAGGDAGRDVSQADAPASCSPIANPCPGTTCDGDHCQAWAQSLSGGGYAHAGIESAMGGGAERCGMGDVCKWNADDAQFECTCGNQGSCIDGQVCVSDTPGGTPSCRDVCVPTCPIGCTSSECLCSILTWPTVCAASGKACQQQSGSSSCVAECPDAH